MEIFDDIEMLDDENINTSETVFSIDVDKMDINEIEGIRDVLRDLIQSKLEVYALANDVSPESEFAQKIFALKFDAENVISIYLNKSLSSLEKNAQINKIFVDTYSMVFDLLQQIQGGGNLGLK